MKTEKIVVTTPTGKEVEMINELEYFNWYTKGYRVLPENYNPHSNESRMMSSRVHLPMPGDFNNWAYYLTKEEIVYKELSDEDKIFIMEQQYEQYTSLWGSK